MVVLNLNGYYSDAQVVTGFLTSMSDGEGTE